MSLRARRLWRRFGWQGAVGGALALLALAEFGGTTLPGLEQAEGLRTQIARLREPARAGAPIEQGGRAGTQAQLDAFERFFPARAAANASLEQLFRISAEREVLLARGDYRLESDAELGLSRYQLSLPVSGPYSNVKAFLRQVLADMPWVSLDGISLQRPNAGEQSVETVLRLSLYLRNDP